MSLQHKNERGKKAPKEETGTLMDKCVGNYEKHPFFVKKAIDAKKLLTKVGLPEKMTEKVN